MKKAIKINISGVIFHIDEDAYDKLKNYLKSVEHYFSDKEGGKEIVDDIESRIAELFHSRVGETKKEAITIEDVTEVTSIMGDPSDFVEEAEEANEDAGTAKETRKTGARGPKRLYRDPDNSVLGGVCGGLGAYFGIDAVIIRILFVVLFIVGHGVWGLVYIILWIAIPRAVTISQKLEMRGERVTISNIEKTVKQEYEDVKTKYKDFEKSEGYRQTASAFQEMGRVLGSILVVVAKVVLVLLGIALVFAGFILLMGFLGVFFLGSNMFAFGWFNGSIFPLSQFLSAFIDPLNLSIILTALFLAVIIPLISIIYGGIKLVFQLKTKDRGVGIVALVIWIASISVLFSLGFIEARKFAFSGASQENVMLDPSPSRTLYLEVEDKVNAGRLEDLTWFHSPSRGIFMDPANEMFYSRPSLSIRHTSAELPELVFEKRARGASSLYAELNAENIIYEWEFQDSVIIIDNMFTVPEDETWNFADVRMRLNLPEGYSIHLGEKTDRIITSARTAERNRISSMTGKKWEMTGEGLIKSN
ncbi:MAG: PspC domain-containing protein [bacterium]